MGNAATAGREEKGESEKYRRGGRGEKQCLNRAWPVTADQQQQFLRLCQHPGIKRWEERERRGERGGEKDPPSPRSRVKSRNSNRSHKEEEGGLGCAQF